MKKECLEVMTEGTLRYQFSAAIARDFERWAKEQWTTTGRAVSFSEYYNQLPQEDKLSIRLTAVTSFRKQQRFTD